MANPYTVVKGDCLWSIAARYLGGGWHYTEIMQLNGLTSTLIHPGDILQLAADSGGGQPAPTPAPPPTTNLSSKPNILYFDLMAGTDTEVFAVWSWDKENTKEYEVKWWYETGQGVWFVGNSSNTEEKQATYSAPANAKSVTFRVRAKSTSRDVNGAHAEYWTAEWSTDKTYYFKDNPPKKPSTPTVTIDKYKLTAKLTGVDELNAAVIQFQVVKNNVSIFSTGNGNISTSFTSYACNVDSGSEYKVRCRGFRDGKYGDWSDYSSNVQTAPSQPYGFNVCKAKTTTSVYLEWSAIANAKTYDIEYATQLSYFDGSDKTSTSTGIETTKFEKTGLDSGVEYFFRLRAVNDAGHSGWSKISSTVIGKEPAPPSTWSSTTTAISGEPLNLYWVHNAADGSSQTYAELEMIVDGIKSTYTIKNTEDEATKDKTSVYSVDTSQYIEGTVIQWRVRTAGITKVYGAFSVQRTIDIYAPPTLELQVKNSSGEMLETLTEFPLSIKALAGPASQAPISYHLAVISNESYETVDTIGNFKMVKEGETIYSKYFDVNTALEVEISANNIDLENNVTYTIICTVSMDSGLTTSNSYEFTVSWADVSYEPTAEIAIDKGTYVAYIRPYCRDENGDLVDNLLLSVYRREFDGSFTELGVNLDNSENTFITDPHPALDMARYRIVGITKSTGAVSYYDVPGYPVGENAVIIQWNEDWTTFDASTEDQLSQPPWTGSLLKLIYNVDVSDSHGNDVSLISYAGRKHPVSYYGTQLGETSSWSMEIESGDEETLYALRRLAVYMGDVYVREPSGSGYWASIKVSISQKHNSLTIPVSMELTRVEGGV